MRELQRHMGLALGTLEYHLTQLEKGELVVTREAGRFKAYFPNGHLDRRDRDVLYYLRQGMPRTILLELAEEPGITFQTLAARLPISPSTVSFHLKKLRKAALVIDVEPGRGLACSDPERVRKLILQYRATFVDDVVDRFASTWMDVGL